MGAGDGPSRGAGQPGWSSTRPTINDVAALSGMSKTTVSNVIRGAGRVSGDTRRRVLESADALGYRPNGLARDLVRRRSDTIGVVVGDLANTFYAELVKMLERRASDEAYTTMVCNTDGNLELETARIEALLERAVSGVVMLQFSGDQAVLDELEAAAISVVVVSCWEERVDCVAVDDHAGTGLAVDHLCALGHRRIAYASGPLIEASTDRSRFAGYAERMRAGGLRAEQVAGTVWDEREPGHARALRELVLGDDPVTAFVVANDLLAVRLMDALESAGLRVPDDASVVGFDGIDLGANSRIGLTTIAQPRAELAQRGLDLLVARMSGGAADAAPRRVKLAPTLLRRRSSAPRRQRS
jgi:DNA-binding LacI/PurR family transcriptional regulator